MQGAKIDFDQSVSCFLYSRSFIPIIEISFDRVAVSVYSAESIVLIRRGYNK